VLASGTALFCDWLCVETRGGGESSIKRIGLMLRDVIIVEQQDVVVLYGEAAERKIGRACQDREVMHLAMITLLCCRPREMVNA